MIAALIIAAGKNAHNAYFEPEKIIGSIPVIKRIIMVFQRAGIERIVVVCDQSSDNVEKLASYMNAIFLHTRSGVEMLDNVKTGLAYLKDKCESVIITHTDIPLFSVSTVQSLMQSAGAIRIPSYRGGSGHPILISAALFSDILSFEGIGGLSGAVKSTGLQPQLVDVEDEGILANVSDNAESYIHLLAGHNLLDIYPSIRIRLVKEKAFYGPGAHQLLELTDETGSVREACRRMGISYNKGRLVIAGMEQQLGYPVIRSQQGGKTGGYSSVTNKGRELMKNYNAFSLDAKRSLQELFNKHFS